MPDRVHNDRGTDFLSGETQNYLLSKSIATSKTSRYNPQGNGQVEKLNGTLWKAIQVSLHSRKMGLSERESVLPDALHSIRSLLCTSTNTTPHERMFNFSRKSTSGKTIYSLGLNQVLSTWKTIHLIERVWLKEFGWKGLIEKVWLKRTRFLLWLISSDRHITHTNRVRFIAQSPSP